MLQLYNAALGPLRMLVPLWSRLRASDAVSRVEWAERRLTTLPEPATGGVWIHGASVGEVRLVETLVRALAARDPELPLCVSCFTRAGRSRLPSPPAVRSAFYVPLDFAGAGLRLLDRLGVRALILVETELWPNLLREAGVAGVPVGLVNARLSPRRMGRYRRLAALYRPGLEAVRFVGAQSEAERERFIQMGVDRERIEVTGNMKYDLPAPSTDPGELRRRAGLDATRPVVVAGSTGPGEDALVLDAFRALRGDFTGLFLVLAPRHVERCGEVEALARARGVSLRRWSSADGQGADGVLVDTIGELAGLYGIGHAAFVGGSLVPVGGHNVLEPAAAGVPVLFGPHTDHFDEPAAALVDAGGGLRVADGPQLERAWRRLLADPDERARVGRRAAFVVSRNRGALHRNVERIIALASGDLP